MVWVVAELFLWCLRLLVWLEREENEDKLAV
jgi:hypothetical protein